MNILYIFAHPRTDTFNGWLKNIAIEKLQATKCALTITDLYAEKFNPVASWHDFNLKQDDLSSSYFLAQAKAYHENKMAEDIQLELNKITWAQHIIFQFPLWWFERPAILKGWFDRTFVKGFAYDAGKVFEKGLLQGKTASLTVSTQSPESAYQVQGLQGAAIDAFLLSTQQTLRFAGIKLLPSFITYDAFNINDRRLHTIKNNYENYLPQLLENNHA